MSRSAVGDPDTHFASKSALWLRPLASHLYRSALCDPVNVPVGRWRPGYPLRIQVGTVAPTPCFASLSVGVVRPCKCPGRPLATRIPTSLRLVPALCVSVLLRAWQAAAHRLRSWVVVRLRSRLLCILGMALAVCGGRQWWHRTAVVDGHVSGDVEIRDWGGDGTAVSGVGRRVRAASCHHLIPSLEDALSYGGARGHEGGCARRTEVCAPTTV